VNNLSYLPVHIRLPSRRDNLLLSHLEALPDNHLPSHFKLQAAFRQRLRPVNLVDNLLDNQVLSHHVNLRDNLRHSHQDNLLDNQLVSHLVNQQVSLHVSLVDNLLDSQHDNRRHSHR
jgi:hypothetical protein